MLCPEKTFSGHLCQNSRMWMFPAVLSHRLHNLHEKVDAMAETAQQVSVKISQEKEKVLRSNNIQKTQY
uniref:Uncharacterized protein n=1 Tax=Arion vulgaris TaxID=1028688 RepID=A0A0B7AC78_9EUPU